MMLISKEGILLEHDENSGELSLYKVDGTNLEIYYRAHLLNGGKWIFPLVGQYFTGTIEDVKMGLESLIK